MAIKVTVENRGVVTEKAQRNSVDIVLPREYDFSTSNLTLGDTEYVLIAPATSAGATGSLPAISANLLGKMYTIMVGNTNPVLVSGSNNINSGSLYTVSLSGQYPALTIMAVSSSAGGYYWHKINAQ